MILAEKKTKRIDSGLESQAFKMQASAKAFEILSSGLYSNRERAVLRELMCNAYDAHIAAGKANVPFEVQLPTSLDPVLKIKDYGTGLSEENVYELFTTYFSSDKTDSNLFVGAFGLGSKSPFAVTDQFTVVSRYNGTKSLYTCFLSEERIPQVSKISENETEEKNGITIQIPVDESKIDRFKQEYLQVVSPFPIKPLAKGIKDEEVKLYKENEVYIKGQGWKIIKGRSYWKDISVIQGNVEYPLNVRSLAIDYNLKTFFDSFISHPTFKLLIYFPLGTLNVATSREELNLDDRTTRNIEKRLTVIQEEIKRQIREKIKQIDNDFELYSFCNNLGYDIRREVKAFEWRPGITVEDALIGKSVEPRYKRRIVFFAPSERGSGVSKYNIDTRMPIYDNTKVFYYDYNKGVQKGVNKIKAAIRKGWFKRATLVYDVNCIRDQYYGNIPYTNLSEFEGPEIESNNTSSVTPEIKVFYNHVSRYCSRKNLYTTVKEQYWSKDFYSMLNHSKKKAICVVSGGNKRCLVNGHTISDEDLYSIIRQITKRHEGYYIKNFIPIVYKVSKPESRNEEFQTHPNIVKIDDVLDFIFTRESPKAIKPIIAKQIKSTMNTQIFDIAKQIDINNIENTNSPIHKLLEYVHKIHSIEDVSPSRKRYISNLMNVAITLKYRQFTKIRHIESFVRTDYVNKLHNKIQERYPLLQYLNQYYYNRKTQEDFRKNVENYINLIDNN